MTCLLLGIQKSDNLLYNTLVHWFALTNGSSTKRLIFQVLFLFKISHRLRALKTLYFYYKKKTKNNLKRFLQRILHEIMKKNNTWNMRRLVDESFVPATQQASVLY